MYGFTVKYSSNIHLDIKDDTLSFASKISNKSFTFENHFFDKFKNDKVLKEDKNFIIGLDGVLLNLASLKNHNNVSNVFDLISKMYHENGINFVGDFKGEFCGFVFEKNTENLYFFNNKTATKQVYYSQTKDSFITSYSIKKILDFRTKLLSENHLEISSVYSMLSFGALLENKTFVQDVFKLGAGEFINFKEEQFKLEKYYDYNSIEISVFDKQKSISRLDEVFNNALNLEYQKDIEYSEKHLATLSGGLDSRMNVMLADEFGYKNKTFCFSQSNYLDEKIAAKIAHDLALKFEFIPLDGSTYLKSLEAMISINNGQHDFNGSAHYNYALNQMDLSDFGLIHTGQIGDGILGGFVSANGAQNFFSKTNSKHFLDKAITNKKMIDNYRDEEIFKLYQRVFNSVNFGSYTVESHQSYLVSPFLDSDVIEISLSIDPKLKYNQAIYIDWIREKHQSITKYKWERTGFRPDKAWKTEFSRYTKKILLEFYKLTKQEHRLSMTPDEYWFNKSKELQEFYDNFFNNNIELVESNREVYQDLKNVFIKDGLENKTLVLTILETIRQFSLKV